MAEEGLGIWNPWAWGSRARRLLRWKRRGTDDAAERIARLKIERILGHRFSEPGLLAQALRHRSHAYSEGGRREDSNERLEFLGDSVLGLAVSDSLYRRFPHLGEGELTQLRSSLVSRGPLAAAASRVGLGDHLLLSANEERQGGRQSESILADAFEAVLGALYRDAGLPPVVRLLERVLLPQSVEILKSGAHLNPKNQLQEFVQRAGVTGLPQYRVLEETGPPHDRHFRTAVIFADRQIGEGEGRSKREAQVEAARDAMRQISSGSIILWDLVEPNAPPE